MLDGLTNQLLSSSSKISNREGPKSVHFDLLHRSPPAEETGGGNDRCKGFGRNSGFSAKVGPRCTTEIRRRNVGDAVQRRLSGNHESSQSATGVLPPPNAVGRVLRFLSLIGKPQSRHQKSGHRTAVIGWHELCARCGSSHFHLACPIAVIDFGYLQPMMAGNGS